MLHFNQKAEKVHSRWKYDILLKIQKKCGVSHLISLVH